MSTIWRDTGLSGLVWTENAKAEFLSQSTLAPGPRFPKASLAYVVCEVHTIIVQFSDRFPKAFLVTNVVKTLVARDGSRGTRKSIVTIASVESPAGHSVVSDVFY